ncbi:hypothetical protein [Enterococcus hulanensis]|uniref:hypothetical protein n=1 Tax=Enterococcus hulanensis TaxID=2559929 RepID=UPI0010F80477|nr:hypothetical protein [Enterococcus hulanensis]
MEDKKAYVYSGIKYYQKQLTAIDERIKELSTFNYSKSLIERKLKRGEHQGDPAWQEITRLLEVRKSYELELENLRWQVTSSDLSLIEFYSFAMPVQALVAVKIGVKSLGVYANCVTEIYHQKVCCEKVSLLDVQETMRQAVCEESQHKLTEDRIQEELVDLGKYGKESFYQGSVILIENTFV